LRLRRPIVTNLLAGVPCRVRVVEVSPRDGLQNEDIVLETGEKLQLIRTLTRAGFEEIEVSSFVLPERVPQLGDASELFAALNADELETSVRYSALVPNRKGLDRALASGVRSIALFTAASETFTQENIGMSVRQSLEAFRHLMPTARENGLRVRAYVSTAFHCPFEERMAPEQVRPVVEELVGMGVDEVSVGDTIGHATPNEVSHLTDALLPVLPLEKFAYHFHDTRGAALANVLMALQYGVAVFDSSAGGVGGCPFAPGAAGNLATEDLLGMLHGMGIETGIDIQKVMDASLMLEAILGRYLISKYLLAEGGSGEL
jgi:hydroxymethylglutaryl-CoA lyase